MNITMLIDDIIIKSVKIICMWDCIQLIAYYAQRCNHLNIIH
uniref:Uncharacterized protein n=1 Tax=viral metagenome TaxID=1070528 RepID=A0A6C0ECD1_9ZZZZ